MEKILGFEDDEEMLEDLIDDYTLADKYLLEGMATLVVDLVKSRRFPETKWLKRRHLEQVISAGLFGSAIWKCLISQVGDKIIRQTGGAWDLEDLKDSGIGDDPEALRSL